MHVLSINPAAKHVHKAVGDFAGIVGLFEKGIEQFNVQFRVHLIVWTKLHFDCGEQLPLIKV
jgi:hypothetical protein